MLRFSVTVLTAVCLVLVPASCRHVPQTRPQTPPEALSANSSTPCSMQVERVCSAIEMTDNYSMRLNVDQFHISGKITVKVHATQCLLDSVRLPWWYQLEVVEVPASMGSGSGDVPEDQEPHGQQPQDTGAAGGPRSHAHLRGPGKFRIPARKHEMHLCNQDSSLVFSSCSPTPFDLPRELTWRSTNTYGERDSLCFRLTLQQSGERGCLQKEVCVSIGDIPKPDLSISAGSGGHLEDTISSYVPVVSEDIGSGSIPDTLGDLETILDDEDAMVRMIKQKYGLYSGDNEEHGSQQVAVPSDKGCLKVQKFYSDNNMPWTPECTCEGYYKAVQCTVNVRGEKQCWCSSPSGSEIQNSRRTINCTDPYSLDFNC